MNLYERARLFFLRQRLHQRDGWTRRQLEEHQAQALGALRTFAYARSPFYQRFHKGLFDKPLSDLPVLTKAMVIEHFDELVADRAIRRAAVEEHVTAMRWDKRFLDRYQILSTSGSTGLRGLFLFNEDEWVTILASYARATRGWTNLASRSEQIRAAGVSSATPWHISARVNTSLRSRQFPTLVLDASEALETMVERLNAWQPALLMGYPSALYALAQKQLAEELHIAPHTIVTSSEVTTADMRLRIQDAWGQQPFDEYGTTEGACLAAECDRHSGMHLFEDLAIVEVVDQDNRPVPPGVYGDKVLLTVLFSRTQPLIRYELSDRVRLAGSPCSCGRPFRMIDAIEGRLEHILYFPTVAGDRRAVHPNVFHRILGLMPCTGWQVVQEPTEVRVLVSGAPEGLEEDALVRALQHELAAQKIVVPPVRVQRVPAIPRELTGKLALIRSNLP